jgi:hypothetical protein
VRVVAVNITAIGRLVRRVRVIAVYITAIGRLVRRVLAVAGDVKTN